MKHIKVFALCLLSVSAKVHAQDNIDCRSFYSSDTTPVKLEAPADKVPSSLSLEPVIWNDLAEDTFAVKKNSTLYRFADATVHTLISPIRWKGKDWLTVGGVFAGTALSSLADKPVRKFITRQDSKFLDNLEQAGYHYGKPYAALIMTGGFLATGVVFKNEWATETAAILGATYLTSGAVQSLMKTAIGRARPDMEEGNMSFKPFSKEPGFHSFPSGHIQMAMVSAMVLAERVKNPWLKGAFYTTAGITFFSRLYVDAHWTSDLVFGTAISYFCTRAIIRRMDQNKTKVQNSDKKQAFKMQFYPNISAYSNGLTMVATF